MSEQGYYSDQHTRCAVCGIDKHTPLRRDEMSGYVCLTCIDKRLDQYAALKARCDEYLAGLNEWRDMAQAAIHERGAIKAQRDELLVALKALRGDKPCGHNYTCCCPDDLATAAIANSEKNKL